MNMERNIIKNIKHIVIGYLLAPLILIGLVFSFKKFIFPQFSDDAFFWFFIPLSITFLFIGVTSLVFKINTFLWVLLGMWLYKKAIWPGYPTEDWQILTDYYFYPEAMYYKTIRFASITFIVLGIIGLIISFLGTYKVFY